MEELKAKLNFLKRWKEDVVAVLQDKNNELDKIEIELIEGNTKLEVYNEIPSEHADIISRLQGEVKILNERREVLLSQMEEHKDVIKSIDNKIKQVEISYRY